jgi:hypothetical protein
MLHSSARPILRPVIIVDDHLAVLAVAGRIPNLGADGPLTTTCSFQFRMARAVADSARAGSLSRRLPDPSAAVQRVLRPPANRLIVLDPRLSMTQAVDIAGRHAANLPLAELAGAAVFHGAAVRVTRANVGRTWAGLMEQEGIDFTAVEL